MEQPISNNSIEKPSSLLPDSSAPALSDYPSNNLDEKSLIVPNNTVPSILDNKLSTEDPLDSIRKDALTLTPQEAGRPTYFNWDQSGAQRFVNSDHYKDIGFDPQLGQQIEEDKYQQVQTGWDETKRMFEGFGSGLVNGFVDQAKSWGNFASAVANGDISDVFKQDTLDEINKRQQDFDNNYHIFQGENPTWYSHIAKAVQSSGNLIGSVAEIGAETALIQAIVAASGGSAAELEGIEAARLADAGDIVTKNAEFIANSEKMAQSLTPPSTIQNMWQGLGDIASKTASAIPVGGNTLKFAADAIDAGKDWSAANTMRRGLLAVTNDVRSLNHAIAFASGNAASTYQQFLNDQIQKYKDENGGNDPDNDTIEQFKYNALKAAKTDGAIATVANLYMEKLAMGNILTARSPLQDALENQNAGIFDKIGIKEGEEPLYLKQDLSWRNLTSSIFKWGSPVGNYGELGKDIVAKGAEFGAYGTVMGAIDNATKSYFNAKYNNSDLNALDAIRNGVSSQFTKEGAGNFLSSFAQGALLFGLAGAAFRKGIDWTTKTASNLLDNTDNNTIKSQSEQATKQAADFVNNVNALWENPLNPVKETWHDAILQNSLNISSQNSLNRSDYKDYQDLKDDATRTLFVGLTKNGLADAWIKRVSDYARDYSQDDLCNLLGVPSTPENYQAIKNNIATLPSRLKDIKQISKEVDNTFKNPFNPWAKDSDGNRLYKNGSPEFYAQVVNKQLYQSAKDYVVIAKDKAGRALERQTSILHGEGGIFQMPFAENLGASTIFSVTSPEFLEKEIALRQQIVQSYGDDKESRVQKSGAEKGLKTVNDYYKSLVSYLSDYADLLNKSAAPDEILVNDEKHKEGLSNLLHSYIENSLMDYNLKVGRKATETAPIPTLAQVRDGMESMMDYYKLGVDHHAALHALNMILDPSVIRKFEMSFLTEYARRQKEYREEKLREDINKTNEQNTGVNEETGEQETKFSNTESKENKPQYEDAEIITEETQSNQNTPEETNDKERLNEDIKQDFIQALGIGNRDIAHGDEEDTNEEPQKLSPQSEQYLKDNPEFAQLFYGAQAIFKDAPIEEYQQYMHGILNKEFDKDIAPLSFDKLSGAPKVIQEENGKYVIESKNAAINGKSFDNIREANKFLQETFPEFTIGDRKFQVGQYLYDDQGKRYILDDRNIIHKAPVKGKQGKSVPVTNIELSKYSDTPLVPEKEVIPEARLQNINEITEVHAPGYTEQEMAANRTAIDAVLRTIPVDTFNDNFSVKVSPNAPRADMTYDNNLTKDNPYITINREPNTIAVYRNGKDSPIFYITHPGKYTFNFDGKSYTIPPKDKFELVYDLHDKPLDEVYAAWVENYQKSLALAEQIDKLLKSGESDLGKGITLHVGRGEYDFIPRSQSDRWPTIEQTVNTGNKLLAIVKQNTKEVVYGSKDARIELPKEPNELGNYAALFQLPNRSNYWVQMVAPLMEKPELDTLAKAINTASEAIRNTGTNDVERNRVKTDINKQLSNLFITQNPNGNQSVSFKFRVKDDGNLSVGLTIKTLSDKGWTTNTDHHIVINSGYGIDKPLSFDSGEQFIKTLESKTNNFLTKKGYEPVKITDQNTRKGYSEENGKIAQDQVMSSKMTTSTDIVKNFKVDYSVNKGIDYQATVPTTGEKSSLLSDQESHINESVPADGELMEQMDYNSVPEKQPEFDFEDPEAFLNQLNIANKLIPVSKSGFTPESVQGIDDFKKWVQDNLPSFINIEEADDVIGRMVNNHVIAGQFVIDLNKLGGTLKVGDTYQYHEAFHSIFRLLLSPEQQKVLLNEAALSNPVSEKRFKEFQDTYGSDKTRDDYQEEYLADKFQEWKEDRNKPLSGGIRGFFQKLWNWIKGIVGRFTGSDIERTFYKADTGYYRNAKLQENEFTTTENEPALKLIQIKPDKMDNQEYVSPAGERIVLPKYLPQNEGIRFSNTIAALFHMSDLSEKGNKRKLLDSILNNYRDTLNPYQDHYKEMYRNMYKGSKENAVDWYRKLNTYWNMFKDADSREQLIESVDEHLRTMGYRQDIFDDEVAKLDDKIGSIAAFDDTADMIGGWDALKEGIKAYIGSTVLPYTDEFGNSQLINGDPMYNAVDGTKVYNGLTQLLRNTPDYNKMIDKLQGAIDKGDSGAVIRRLFTDTGFTRNEDGTWSVLRNETLFKQFLNGFRQANMGHIFSELDINKGTTRAYEADRENAAKNQTDKWAESFDELYWRKYENTTNKKSVASQHTEPLITLRDKFLKNVKSYDNDQEFITDCQDISNKIKESLGITISPDYIAYSAANYAQDKTPYMNRLLSVYKADALKPDDINTIRGIITGSARKNGNNPFEEGDTGALGRLRDIAAQNARFDESVDISNYKDAEGNNRYGFQKFNYILEQTVNLNDPDFIEKLQNDKDYSGSHLLNDERWLNWNKEASFADGIALRVHNVDQAEGEVSTNSVLDTNRQEGALVKNWGKRELNAYQFTLYNNPIKSGDVYGTWVMPVTIADKSTIYLASMPVINSIGLKKDGSLGITDTAMNKLLSIVHDEADRIRRVKEEINTLSDTEKIEGYHTGQQRGLKFDKAKFILGDLAEKIEGKIGTEGNMPELSDAVLERAIEKHFLGANGVIDKYIDNELVDTGLIQKTDTGYINKLLPNYLFTGISSDKGEALNITGNNFKKNIAQVYLSNYLNSEGYMHLLLGDRSKGLAQKDIVKRMAFLNAAGDSAYTPYIAPDLGIHHPFTEDHLHVVTVKEPTYKSADIADAQMYCTSKGMRYMLFGFGKLTKTQADLLTKIEKGQNLSPEEVFGKDGLITKGGAFNSLKPVYADGQLYLKCSSFMLTKEMVMVKDPKGGYMPDIRRQGLYDMWKKLTDFEDKNDTVALLVPESASKMVHKNIAGSIQEINDGHFQKANPNFLKLQQENPSNKLTITDSTQAKRQVLAEQDDKTEVLGKSVGDIKKDYLDSTAQRLENSFNDKLNSLFSMEDAYIELNKSFDTGKITPELGRFYDQMRHTLEAIGADEQTLQFLETRAGEPVYELNFPSTLTKFTEILLNYFGSAFSEKVPGLSATQVSNWEMNILREVEEVDENGGLVPGKWRTIPTDEYRNNPSKFNKKVIKWTDPETRTFSGLRKGDIVLDSLRANVPEYDNKGNLTGRYYHETIMPAHHIEDADTLPEALKETYANRIPYADKNSGGFNKLVDYLASYYGSIIVEPYESVLAAGADYDIDKRYVKRYDVYIDGKKLVKYGTASSNEGKFKEYLQYQVNNNSRLRDIIDQLKGTEEGIISDIIGAKDTIIKAALKELKLPSSVKEFIERGGENLNQGVLNNKVLDAQIALSSNKDIATGDSPINLEPTSTKLLEDLIDPTNPNGFYQLFENALKAEGLSEDSRQYLQDKLYSFSDPAVDANDMEGISVNSSNNWEGKKNVGVAANGVPVLSFLNLHDVENFNPIKFNNIEYKDLSSSTSNTGLRKFAALTAYVNAMTDNAKLKLAAKLGLSFDALSDVMAMLTSGMEMRDIQLHLLQPAVSDYYKQIAYIKGKVKTPEEERSSKSSILKNAINNLSGAESKELSTQDLESGITGQDKSIQLSALENIQKANDLGNELLNLSVVLSLQGGLPPAWENMDRIKTSIDELRSENAKTNISNYLDKDPVVSKYLGMFHAIDKLSPKLFIERSSAFKQLQDSVLANFRPLRQGEKANFNKQLKLDLLSFLSIEGYKNKVGVQDLSNGLIYDSLKGDNEDITEVVSRLKRDLKGRKANYFVNQFLRPVKAIEEGNKSKINLVKANNWAKLSNSRQIQLRDSFMELVSNPQTRADAMKLFHYLLVKDGGQFKGNSFIKYIAPAVFKDLMDSTKEVKDVLAAKGDIKDIFGTDINQLMNKFVSNYSTHIDNEQYLKFIKNGTVPAIPFSDEQLKEKGVDIDRVKRHITADGQFPVFFSKEGNISIDLFRGIKSESGKFGPTEKMMMHKNFEYIKSAGFEIEEYKNHETGQKAYDIQFPAVIRNGNSIYKLQTVSGDKEIGHDLIKQGSVISSGARAIYVPTETTGARGTYKAGGANFGELPYSSQLLNANNSPAQIDILGYSPLSAPDSSTLQEINEPQKNEVPESIPTSSAIKELSDKYGISISVENGKPVAYKNNEPYIIPEGVKTPAELLQRLSNKPSGLLSDQEGQEYIDENEEYAPVKDWKMEIERIWNQKPEESRTLTKEEWINDARNVYLRLVNKVSDNEILDAIRNCF